MDQNFKRVNALTSEKYMRELEGCTSIQFRHPVCRLCIIDTRQSADF